MITAYNHSYYELINRRVHSVRSIGLEEVLERTGSNRHRCDKAKWYTSQGVVSINGEKFINWTTGIGGGGAIDLVIHLMECDFKAAVNWLWENFSPSGASGAAGAGSSSHHNVDNVDLDMRYLKTLELPKRDKSKLPHLIQYLTHQRSLPGAIINYLIRCGMLYADDKGNAVFLLIGKGKRVVGAEIRGTRGRDDHPKKWHGMASGSKKDMGCFYLRGKGANKVVLCESAIDAISYFVLHSNCMAASTAGANPKPLWLPKLIDKGFEIFCAFDSDMTGDRMAYEMITLYPVVKRLRPEKHDWNEVLMAMRH